MIEESRSFCVFWLLGQVCHNRNFKRYGGPDAGLGKLKLLRLQLGVLEFGIIHVGRRMAHFSTPFATDGFAEQTRRGTCPRPGVADAFSQYETIVEE